MDQELLEKVMNQVKAELGAAATPAATVAPAASAPAAALSSMKGMLRASARPWGGRNLSARPLAIL